MIRYIAGESELKFIIRNKDSSIIDSNFSNEIGIRQLTLFIPIERREDIIDNVKALQNLQCRLRGFHRGRR